MRTVLQKVILKCDHVVWVQLRTNWIMDELKMNLQTILFGQFTPPLAKKVTRHFILQEKGKPLKQYEPPPVKPSLQETTITQLAGIIRDHPGICTNELTEMTGRAKSYLYRMMLVMQERGMVNAVRGKPPRRGGPKTTLFYSKD